MKKNYVLLAVLLLASSTQAQQVIDFEAHPLSAESYDNGSAGGGDFVFTDVTFTNYYDTAWGSWNGFSISNITDNITSGWGNQYSAYTGMGSDGSENYAVFYPWGQISGFPSDPMIRIDSLKITNTAYAAIAMRDGDAFSKKFGSPNGADGNPDGTNGEDYYRVWVIGEDYMFGQKDSVEFYLADFRFADSTQDYIVDGWVNIDLSNFSFNVHHIDFRLESSDNGAWGMNTPAYFAVDDITYSGYWGIKETEANAISMYPNPANEVVIIDGGEGELSVMTMNGKIMQTIEHNGTSTLNVVDLNAGIYIISVENNNSVSTSKLIVE